MIGRKDFEEAHAEIELRSNHAERWADQNCDDSLAVVKAIGALTSAVLLLARITGQSRKW